MKKKIMYLFFPLCFLAGRSIAQSEEAPASGNAMAAARDGAIPVNLYTGMPSISFPLYNFKNANGLSLGMSLDYFSGGIKTSEPPGSAGLGWNLNVGGVVTRTVRGIADDRPDGGYLYTAAFADDERANTFKLYNGCIDAEQDIYQYNFNGRSGSFYIGKNNQVIVAPLSKLKISFVKDSFDLLPVGDQTGGLRSFTITTEDGIKYYFDNVEYQVTGARRCGTYPSLPSFRLTYGTAFYLSKIAAPFSHDTIRIAYTKTNNASFESWNQNYLIIPAGNIHTDTSYFSSGHGFTDISNKVPEQISFPDSSKINFVYSAPGQFRYTSYPVLQRIKFSDTVFRFGYMLNWDTSNVGNMKRDYLTGFNYYTGHHIMPGYQFTYNAPHFPVITIADHGTTNFGNKKDHWGFYNGANNSIDYVPTIPGLYTGADRDPDSLAIASTLSAVKDPSGGTTFYQYENNDVYPITNSKQFISVNANGNTQTSVSLSRAQSVLYTFTVAYNPTYSRIVLPPISGAGNLVCTITSTDGLTTYHTATVNLLQMFYTGETSFTCTMPNGSYLFKTSLAGGTTATGTLPVNISWYNQPTGVGNATIAGGIRIKQVTHFDSLYNKTDTVVTYRYVTTDGKSSGFGSSVPVYDNDTYLLGSSGGVFSILETNHEITSNPIDHLNYGDADFVGYKRVEVIKGSLTHNLGKQVHEFTGPEEGFVNTDPAAFPFMPRIKKDWAAGLLKRVLVYDSLGRLIQKTQNVYSDSTVDLSGDVNFRSVKFARITRNASIPSGEFPQDCTGQWHYPQIGRSELIATVDSFYRPDNSVSVTNQQFEYDTCYNIKKIIRDYDKTLGLFIEKRNYYTYDYTIGGALGQLRDSGFTTPISSETWITGDGNPRLVSADITGYVKVGLFTVEGIKPGYVYSLVSNKPVPESTIGLFDPSVLVRDSGYIKRQQDFIFDQNSGNRIQVTDAATGQASSTMFGYNSKYAIARVSNAAITDIAYTSFETRDAGNWTIPSYVPDSTKSITGRCSYELSFNYITKTGLNTAREYLLTFWLRSGSTVYVSAGTPVLTDTQNGWEFYTLSFTSVSTLQISGYGWMDELRLHPKDANMSTATYTALGQATSTCDANNTITYYQYDLVNRLKVVRDKDLNVIKKYDYPDDLVTMDQAPDWVLDSSAVWDYRICETDSNNHNTGNVLKKQTDRNFYSETYQAYRYVFDKIDYTLCPLPEAECGDNPAIKSVNGICEEGCKATTSSIFRKALGQWECTYHYEWSDSSFSIDYIEYKGSPCSLHTICPIL
jgi:hypothetical protein